ncbi:MAG: dTDP-4-dehydrorhamnose 3,5-epimerase [Armatimonadetes bacterium]|nr:dTDP-4-dehydrorhamnose 3,5-epimerase [Armatimonadota bacterium]MBS1725194.1 dTDP-4-dehydrorhamnose 3,5-epimerase family protein [Armatimonadota bacterium]
MQLAEGVVIKSLKSFKDSRGYLTELFRSDELPEGFLPEMAYISVTHPGISRGPHEHVYQTDLFGFVDGTYELRLWENREGYEPWELKIEIGKDNPTAVIVPPGVVHGYKNIGDKDAFVLNFPNKLYAGKNRAEIVDEIRHENTDSVFTMD